MSKRVITFGQWNGEPVKWLVLKEDEFKMLIISKSVYYSGTFGINSKWKDSNIRKYLNSEFLEELFTDIEKEKIVNTFLLDPDRTKDNVFILSKDEVENLLTSNERSNMGSFFTRSASGSDNVIISDGNHFVDSLPISLLNKSVMPRLVSIAHSYNVFPSMFIKK